MRRPQSATNLVPKDVQIGRASLRVGPIGTSIDLLATELSALRRLARERRAISFGLFCNTRRLVEGSGSKSSSETSDEPRQDAS